MCGSLKSIEVPYCMSALKRVCIGEVIFDSDGQFL